MGSICGGNEEGGDGSVVPTANIEYIKLREGFVPETANIENITQRFIRLHSRNISKFQSLEVPKSYKGATANIEFSNQREGCRISQSVAFCQSDQIFESIFCGHKQLKQTQQED